MAPPSLIVPGVYRRRDANGKLAAIQFDLNTAHTADRNGINMMPATPVKNENGQQKALTVTIPALRRILAEIEDEL